ncbi:MAG TPA: GAF domain-containing sensor histidine kinase [Anaerolineaceae bacterium]|nr:GAF domain-containing sensor histidine kinase [Anaerolineaceae bacterium]
MSPKQKLSNGVPFYKSDDFNQGSQSTSAQEEISKLEILNEVGLAITQLLDLQEILNFSVDIIVNKLGIAECLIYIWNEGEERFDVRQMHGVTEITKNKIEERRITGFDLVKQVADSRNAIYIPLMGQEPNFNFEIREKYKKYSYIGFPLISRNMVIGVIELITPIKRNLVESDLAFFKTLGRSIGVAIDNALLVKQIQKQKNDAITLFQLGTKISSSLSLKDVLNEIAEGARLLVNTDIAMVGLFQKSCNEVRIWSTSGSDAEKLEGLIIPVADGPGSCLVNGEEFFGEVNNSENIHLHNMSSLAIDQIKSYLAVPLHISERFIGIIEVMSKETRKFRPDDILLLKQLGYHVYVALEDAHLHEQLRYGAALEEQNRLARELHDHLAQAMGFIKIKAIMTNDLLSKGDHSKAQEHLNGLINTTSVLYTDLREAIFNLRNTDSEPGDFLTQLQDYLREYEHYYGLEVRLSVDDIATTEFSSEVGNQVMRIIQEALSNVRRHACASHVWMKFWQESSKIIICIEDDGNGFNPDEVVGDEESKQSYGLKIMQERVKFIDGELTIESRSGRGTKVLVQLPSVYIN